MNPKYKQLENEDNYEYGLRLIEIKVEQNPSDLEWSDIVDLLGLDVHYDSLRKAANVTPYSGYHVMKYFKQKATQDLGSAYLDEIEQKMLEFKKERQRFFDQRNALNKVVRDLARKDENSDIFERAITSGVIPRLDYVPCVIEPSGNDLLVSLNDLHFGACVDNYYVIAKLYDALKNAKGVKHFAENSGVTQTAVDEMLKQMRRYGRVNICGDYSVVSQFNDFAGYKTFGANTIPFGADAVAEEIRKTGLLSFYNGSHIVELPNALDFTRMNADKTSYELYMPQGLLFFIPQGKIAPLQIFRRGGMTTMTGDDIVTRQHLTRFDMEIGAGVAEGMEDQIGLLSDTNFEVPSL